MDKNCLSNITEDSISNTSSLVSQCTEDHVQALQPVDNEKSLPCSLNKAENNDPVNFEIKRPTSWAVHNSIHQPEIGSLHSRLDSDEDTNVVYTSYGEDPSIHLQAALLDNNREHGENETKKEDNGTQYMQRNVKKIEYREDRLIYNSLNRQNVSKVAVVESECEINAVTPLNPTVGAMQRRDSSSQVTQRKCVCACVAFSSIFIMLTLSAIAFLGNNYINHSMESSVSTFLTLPTTANSPVSQISNYGHVTLYIDWNSFGENYMSENVNISWDQPSTPLVTLCNDKRLICIQQNGTYLLLISLSLQSPHMGDINERRQSLICLKNNRSITEEKCQRISMRVNTSQSVHIHAVMTFFSQDSIWVSVHSENRLYKNDAGSYFVITKLFSI